MKTSATIVLTVYCVIMEIVIAIRMGRSTRPEVEHYRTYKSAPNGIVAYLPASRFNSMPFALHRVQNTPNVVAAYLPNQYASPESKPWALPPRFIHDTPNVVAAYLPAQYSAGMPWRLPLQTSATNSGARRS